MNRGAKPDCVAAAVVQVRRASDRPRNVTDLWVAGIVGAIAIIAFLPVMNNRFVDQWDDQTNFLNNQDFRGIGWPQMKWAWTTTLQGAYQPLAWILLEVEFVTWGLDPRGYHLVSLLLHSINAVLCYGLTQVIVSCAVPGRDRGRRREIALISGLVAALFAVHPLRVEVVAWASCQPYLPCAGFAILSVLCYLHGGGNPRRKPGWYLVSLLFFAASIGCHATPVCLPAVLLILDMTSLGRLVAGRPMLRLLIEKLPYVVLAMVVALIAYRAKADVPPHLDYEPGPARLVAERVATAAYGLTYYHWKTICPVGLSAYHFRPDRINLTECRFAASLGAVGALLVFTPALWWRYRPIFSAFLSETLLLLPNLGLIAYGLAIVADRYSYIGTMPLYVLLALWLARSVALSRTPRVLLLVIVLSGLALVGVLTPLSWSQCRTWRDSNVLREQAMRVGSGRDAMLESNLGIDLFSAGRVEEGLAHLRRAIEMDPSDPSVHENLGVALYRCGDLNGSISQFLGAVRVAPNRFRGHYELGLILSQSGRSEAAAAQLAEAVRLQPNNAEAHACLGNVLLSLGRRSEATAEFAKALIRTPRDAPESWPYSMGKSSQPIPAKSVTSEK